MNQAEWTDSKHKLVQAMNQGELHNYELLYESIEEGIVKTRAEIQTSKEELVQARNIRRNRMEYDALAKVICKNPDRDSTGKKLSEIRTDLAALQKTEEALDEKLELRKKQFHVLVHTIHQLQSLLDMEKKEDAAAAAEQNGGDLNTMDSALNTSNISSEVGGLPQSEGTSGGGEEMEVEK